MTGACVPPVIGAEYDLGSRPQPWGCRVHREYRTSLDEVCLFLRVSSL